MDNWPQNQLIAVKNWLNLIVNFGAHSVEIVQNGLSVKATNGANSVPQQAMHQVAGQAENSTNHQAPTQNVSQLPCESDFKVIYAQNVSKFLCGKGAASSAVTRGNRVAIGNPIGYLSALGTIAPIVRDKDGVIADILLQNGDRVEFGAAALRLH